MSEHSPLPWTIGEDFPDEIFDGAGQYMGEFGDNTRLIVTGVNYHARLIEALRDAGHALTDLSPGCKTGRDIDALLTEIEGNKP